MTAERLEQIKEKIGEAKQKKAKAEGAIERIEAQWKSDFDLNGATEAEARVKELEADIERDEGRQATLEKELEAVTDWDEI